MEFLIIIVIALVAYIIYSEVKKNKQPAKQSQDITVEDVVIPVTETLPYRKKLLLTKNEWSFYKSLKPVADELGYSVLAKIRVADIVEPLPNKDRAEWQKYFNKINRKHIDFVLARPENLQIVLLIELDDNTHNETQKKRDEFIEQLYAQTGYKLLRVRGTGDIKERIEKAIKTGADIET